MFYLRHGEDQITMFNAKCQTVVLMNFIKAQLQLPSSVSLDFVPVTADPKLIAPIGVAEKGDPTYANTYLALRGSYALLSTREDEDGAKEWTLLWKSKQDERDKIAAALDLRSQEEKKKMAAVKGKKK